MVSFRHQLGPASTIQSRSQPSVSPIIQACALESMLAHKGSGKDAESRAVSARLC